MACVRKRRGKYVLDYFDQNGKRKWETTELNKRDAETLLRKRLDEIGKGEYQAPNEYKTFEEMVEAYKAEVYPNLRDTTRKDYDIRINVHLLPPKEKVEEGAFSFSGWKIRSITPEVVSNFKAKLLDRFKERTAARLRELEARLEEATRKQKGEESVIISEQISKLKRLEEVSGGRTTNKCLILLGAMFAFAIGRRWMTYNPAVDVDKLKEESLDNESVVDVNILKPEEIRLLLSKMEGEEQERWKLMVKTAVLTGLREGEILGLQWPDVDWNASQFIIRRTCTNGKFYLPKTKKSRRRVDVPRDLLMDLKRWKLKCPKGKDDLVFPNGAGNPENHSNLLRRGFYPALRRAGLRQIRFHDLRHTFASLLIMNNEHPKYIQEQLGHSSIKVTMDVYGHLMNPTNSKAAEKLAALALGDPKEGEGCSRIVATEVIGKRDLIASA